MILRFNHPSITYCSLLSLFLLAPWYPLCEFLSSSRLSLLRAQSRVVCLKSLGRARTCLLTERLEFHHPRLISSSSRPSLLHVQAYCLFEVARSAPSRSQQRDTRLQSHKTCLLLGLFLFATWSSSQRHCCMHNPVVWLKSLDRRSGDLFHKCATRVR